MRKIFFVIILLTLGFVGVTFFASAKLAETLKGKILLQVEKHGEAWYVNPVNAERYYMGRPADAFELMRSLGVGITNTDLLKIPVAEKNFAGQDSDGDGLSDMIEDSFGTNKYSTDTDQDGHLDKAEVLSGYSPVNKSGAVIVKTAFAKSHLGKIFLQVQQNGEAWYINPIDSKRYFLGRPADAFEIMRGLGLGISNANLDLITVSLQSLALPQEVEPDVQTHILPEEPEQVSSGCAYHNPACGSGYNCVGNVCVKKTTGTVDVLVIVNLDDYNITNEDVSVVLELANDFWLEPKTGIKFNLFDTDFFSFKERDIDSYTEYLNSEYFSSDNAKLNTPDYILVFNKDSFSEIYGGYSVGYQYYWLLNDKGSYCSDFPTLKFNDISVPSTVIDYKHKYAICGYDDDYTTIISNTAINGQCQNQEGTSCVFKNGYQMCSNLQDDFLAQNILYLTAKTIVHEFLHPYGATGNLDHFGTQVCKENMGDNYSSVINKGPMFPFDSVAIEYATMCPNVWKNLIDSKQDCS